MERIKAVNLSGVKPGGQLGLPIRTQSLVNFLKKKKKNYKFPWRFKPHNNLVIQKEI